MIEIAVVVALILLNGVFSCSELAVVSSRPRRLQAMAEAGSKGARAALVLREDPGRFLSTVQIGITLVGILAGAFSGEALGGRLSAWFQTLGMPAGIASPLGFGLVIAVVTYLSIVIGELVPKRFALRNPEGFASVIAPLMTFLSRVALPVAWLLDASTGAVFRLLGVGPQEESKITDEEIRSLVADAESSGTIASAERHLISGVMRLGDRPVRGIMTPRTEVEWVDINADEARIREILSTTHHSRLPVGEGSTEALIGVIQTRELLARVLAGQPLDLRSLIRPVQVIPETADALDAMALLQAAEVPVVLVHDEYGHFEGLVTPADLLETIAGVFRTDLDHSDDAGAVQRQDGSWLLAGWLPADEMAEHLAVSLPAERNYHTVAGHVLATLGRLPRTGESVNIGAWRFEVVDLDHNRIDKVLATRIAAADQVRAGLHRAA
ncbi:HlyC/CorC family transporter [Roseomonas sp. SSH11]|uniref:HlyC/CorC family transporter n=1 Tax=Pararoseomonas baculiformis TaxID=2820812 RepID=A0ABS4AHB4_9PROT|nr:hemolysin family protein [Pararoseomonas baculiformis]MBP0445913.1 HlyC/CorC family transporter [Pararoseomonas baculiformis]